MKAKAYGSVAESCDATTLTINQSELLRIDCSIVRNQGSTVGWIHMFIFIIEAWDDFLKAKTLKGVFFYHSELQFQVV